MFFSLLFACATSDSAPPAAAPKPAEVATKTPQKTSSISACDLLTPADVAKVFDVDKASVAEGKEETVKRRSLCSWTWEGGRVDVQRSEAPPEHVKGWAPRMVQAKLAAGGEAEAGLGRTSSYVAKNAQMFWENDDQWLLHLSAAGNRPGVEIPRAKLRSLADRFPR